MKTKLTRSVAVIALLPALTLMGCDLAQNSLKIDRDSNLEFQDYRDAMAPREIPAEGTTAKAGEGVPDFADYTADRAANLKPMPLVSISVNENVPLKDVLYELAHQANYDVELDPRIKGAVIFSARNRPFDQVMERISDIAGLRYKIDDNVVRVELDTPYSATYKLDYLPMIRNVTSKVANNANVSGGDTASTGSSFSLDGKSEIDFWKELDINLKQILESNTPENALKTKKSPSVSLMATSSPADTASSAKTTPPSAPGSSSNSNTEPGSTATTVPPVSAASVGEPTASVTTTTEDGDDVATSSQDENKPSYSLNRQAGLISVYANEKIQKKVKEYLDDLRRSVGAQVLIEAKVFEVSLEDQFATGINWEALDLPVGEFSLAYSSTGSASPLPTTDGTANFSLGYSGTDLNAVIEAVSRFGTVHALASPRLTVLNNQSAVLNVAQNKTYFEISIETTTGDSSSVTTTTVESTAKSVPEGVLVNVTPSIDPDSKEVTMTIRPTISRIESYVNDPGVAYAIAQSGLTGSAASSLQSQVPNVSVQEFDSVIKVKSGEVVVLGGLLQDRSQSEQNGTPVLAEAPLIGGLFRNQGDTLTKTELVVFLRATVLDSGAQTIHQTDRDLYKMFSRDRRPLPM